MKNSKIILGSMLRAILLCEDVCKYDMPTHDTGIGKALAPDAATSVAG
jgi:hypothetical protein